MENYDFSTRTSGQAKQTRRPSNGGFPYDIRNLQGSPNEDSAIWCLELRRRLGLTQSQLAKALGPGGKNVSSWERGESRPSNPVVREALSRAGESMGMPAIPPPGKHQGNGIRGPQIDPGVEDRFRELFGS